MILGHQCERILSLWSEKDNVVFRCSEASFSLARVWHPKLREHFRHFRCLMVQRSQELGTRVGASTARISFSEKVRYNLGKVVGIIPR